MKPLTLVQYEAASALRQPLSLAPVADAQIEKASSATHNAAQP